MIIPTGYAHVIIGMGGPALPTRGAVTMASVNPSSLSAQDVANAYANAWITHVMPVINSSVVGFSVLAKLGPNATGPQAESSSGAVGGVSLTPATANCAFLVQKRTALGGRRNRGRIYLPGVSETDVDAAGVITGATATALQGAFGDVFADLVAADLAPVLLHNDVGPPTPLVNFNVSSQIATQRKRMRR